MHRNNVVCTMNVTRHKGVSYMGNVNFSVDRCVICGDMVPEGRQVCFLCEGRILREDPVCLERAEGYLNMVKQTKRRFWPFKKKT